MPSSRLHRRFALAALAGTMLVPLTASQLLAQTLDSFAVLAGSAVTDAGSSVITGNVGVSPGASITGFPPGIVNAPYAIYNTGAVPGNAQNELTTRYNTLQNSVPTVNLTGQDLGNRVLTPGVYVFDNAAQLTGAVTLDGLGNPNAQFIFIVGSTLTTASNSAVQLINGTQGGNVSFVVGSSATLGTDTAFAGQIVALTSITLTTGADIICGAALARNGAVTLDTNTISVCVTTAADLGTVADGLATRPSTDTEMEVAATIDDYVTSGGVLPTGFAALAAFLSPDDLQIALAQLSGETATAVAAAGTQATGAFLGQVFDRLGRANRIGFGQGSDAIDVDRTSAVDAPAAPADDATPATVRVLGYGPLERTPLARFGYDTGDQAADTHDPKLWNVWAAAQAETSHADGDALAGSHDRSIDSYSLSAGVDFYVAPDLQLGFAISGGRSDFGLSEGFGGGNSDVLQAAIYGRKDFGPVYVAGGLAAAWNDVKTSRVMTVGGADRFDAAFSAYNVAARVETGYRFVLPDGPFVAGSSSLTPYAALQVQNYRTEAYSETALSGDQTFALNYGSRSALSTHTELGFRAEHTLAVGTDTLLALTSRLAWAHDDAGDDGVTASFQSLPGSSFTTYGARGAENSLLVSLGAELQLRNGFAVLGQLDGGFADGAQSYAATARLSYAW